jgi:hypothetical protein
MPIAPDYMSDGGGDPDLNFTDFKISQSLEDPEVLEFYPPEFTNDIKSYRLLVIADDDYYQFMPFDQRPDFTNTLYNFLIDSDPANGYTPGDIISAGTFIPGNKYKFRMTAYSGYNLSGSQGNSVTKSYLVPKPLNATSVINVIPDTGSNPKSTNTGPPTWIPGTSTYKPPGSEGESSESGSGVDEADTTLRNNAVDQATINGLTTVSQRGVLVLSGPSTQEQYNTAIAHNTFSAINIPTNLNSYEQYYSFGTTMYLSDEMSNPNQSAGFGFFLSAVGTDGYFIRLQTSAAVATYNSKKELTIIKIQNNEKRSLKDSQTTDLSKLTGVYGGKIYKIDVKVKATKTRTDITVYVNGFKITATDLEDLVINEQNPSPGIKVLAPTQKIGAFAYTQTKACFDYIYGSSISLLQYNDTNYGYGSSKGQYSKNILSAQYGDKIFNPYSINSTTKSIEEFGVTAREIRVVKTRFNARPAKPVYISTGLNQLVEVVGSKLTNFGAEMYIANNSGVFVPLDDGVDNNFFIIGTSIAKTGEYVQSSTVLNDFTVEEPIIFQSNWIQRISEAISLESWIKNKWSNKQMTVTMNIFGNPLLSVGDIIKVKHSYQNLDETRKFIILNVNHTYNQGLETEIICRTL